MLLSTGSVLMNSFEQTAHVQLREDGWTVRDIDEWGTSAELRSIVELDGVGDYEVVVHSGSAAGRGTNRSEPLNLVLIRAGHWSVEQMSSWREHELRLAHAEVWQSPSVRSCAFRRFIREESRFVRQIMGWDDGDGVF